MIGSWISNIAHKGELEMDWIKKNSSDGFLMISRNMLFTNIAVYFCSDNGFDGHLGLMM